MDVADYILQFIMSANASGIIGSQLFQGNDAPHYLIGWTVIICLVSLALFAMLVANWQYWLLNRKIVRGGAAGGRKFPYVL